MTEPMDGGFQQDLRVLRERRRMLKLFAGLSVWPLLNCGGVTAMSADGGTCTTIPTETGGPFPGDGTNGVNALTQSGIVRSDLRSSFGTYSGVAEGIPLTINLNLVNVNGACGPLENYAVYAWHCDREGKYSLYTVTTTNYLRGVQVTNANGQVTFQTVFPGCYSGRWPHVHFEIYRSLTAATLGTNALRTSQLALPQTNCAQVYGTSGYETSVSNLAKISLATDGIFRDGTTLQMATVSGDVTSGFTASLDVGVEA